MRCHFSKYFFKKMSPLRTCESDLNGNGSWSVYFDSYLHLINVTFTSIIINILNLQWQRRIDKWRKKGKKQNKISFLFIFCTYTYIWSEFLKSLHNGLKNFLKDQKQNWIGIFSWFLKFMRVYIWIFSISTIWSHRRTRMIIVS